MIIQADSRHIPLSDQSVNCIITSPPYWSLRKYDIPDLIWDGEDGCEHEWGKNLPDKILRGTDTGPRKEVFKDIHLKTGQFCLRCSAWRGQLGLEPTIDLYLKHLLQIMDECKRVLREDGTMWVNLGDSYAGSWGNYWPQTKDGPGRSRERDSWRRKAYEGTEKVRPPTAARDDELRNMGLQSKSLCLIPERFAIEMVNRGWILRSKIIWHKPNCMPASVKDRFTVDFEPVFFFVKSRKYWFEKQYDELSPLTLADKRNDTGRHTQGKIRSKYKIPTGWNTHPGGHNTIDGRYDQPDLPSWYRSKTFVNPKQGRNRRCVWTIPTQPYPESHFATFPEALVEPMIKSGCPVAGTVLDPFCGSGTVLKVSESLQRKAIGIDLGYQELAEKRKKWNQVEMMV